jgi:multicomponent Na+:H+ antiporter subunit D
MTALLLALLIPWVVGVSLMFADGRRRSARIVAVGALAATLAALLALAIQVLSSGPLVVTTGNWPVGIGITLRADAMGVTFAVLSVAMLTAAVTHQLSEPAAEREFPGLVVLLALGLIGTFLTGDVFNFYVFFELALAAS